MNLITILGPTASGKTKLASLLAYKLKTEIISADSRQVYKKLDIGTGKDYKDYIINGEKQKYNLIDIVEAGTKYNLFQYKKDFLSIYNKIINKGKIPILCGGSPLYLDAVLNNYELEEVPENKTLREKLENCKTEELIEKLKTLTKLHNKTDITSKKRLIRAIEIAKFKNKTKEDSSLIKTQKSVKIESLNLGIRLEADKRREKIKKRLSARLEEGLIEEVENLIKEGISTETLIYYGLEYKFVSWYLLKKIKTKQELFDRLFIAICQFSKRQMTFYRKMEREGTKINWLG